MGYFGVNEILCNFWVDWKTINIEWIFYWMRLSWGYPYVYLKGAFSYALTHWGSISNKFYVILVICYFRHLPGEKERFGRTPLPSKSEFLPVILTSKSNEKDPPHLYPHHYAFSSYQFHFILIEITFTNACFLQAFCWIFFSLNCSNII